MNARPPLRRRAGFTLIEVCVAMALFGYWAIGLGSGCLHGQLDTAFPFFAAGNGEQQAFDEQLARKAAATETWPRVRRKASSSGVASRWISENATSPPSKVRPSRLKPSLRLAATEPTPAIAITPSAMQAMNT